MIIRYRTYKNFKEADYLNELQNTPFPVSNIFDDLDDEFWFHNKLLETGMDSNAPHKKWTIPTIQLPYMNGQLRKLLTLKICLNTDMTLLNQTIKKTYTR